jgi:flagellar FliL protein
MAAAEEKTTVSSGEAAPPPAAGGNKLMLLIGIGLGAIVIGVVLALFVVKPMMSGPAEPETAEVAQEAEAAHGEEPAHGETKHGAAGQSLIYAIKDIIVNPAGTGGSRYLSVSVGFELGSPELEASFTAKEAMVRDALITILSSRTVNQLTDAKQKEIVRHQIKKRVSDLMRTDQVSGVYFTDFVLQ